MPCLIRITIKSAINYCCRIIRLNLKMMVSAQVPIYRRGAMAPHLGGQDSIISIEWYAKVWHASFFVSLAPCLSSGGFRGGDGGDASPPTSLKVTILAEKSASVSNKSAPFRDASPPTDLNVTNPAKNQSQFW